MGKMEEYDVLKLLGKGSFGSVYCVKRVADRSLHVMKKISIHNMPTKERQATEQECKVLQRLRHPGVVCYEDSFIHKNRQLCIVMAYCEGGDLSSLIEKRKMRYFPEKDVLSWFIQISLALQYMHEEHILHRDLKTQNIFLTKNNMIKLGDFGIAKVLEGTLEMAKTVIGTPYYMSPELFRNQPYSYKSDIWSLGCVLYELVSLRHAFDAREMKGLVQKILRGQHSPVPPGASKDVKDLLKAMLSLSPKSRPSVNEVLSMPFIRKEMSSYIKSQLGDESAANILQDDAKALNYRQIEQARLEKQARKLGFDVQKRPDNIIEEPALPPARKVERELKEPPKQSSLPSAAEAERIRLEERERDRQQRAREFLERELRAKERAEEALRRLQKEKQDRVRALQQQKELRAKRMQHVHPKGEAGNMNEWQSKLAKAQAQHEERRRLQGMQPTPRANSNQEQARKVSVLEQRNREARDRERERLARDRGNAPSRPAGGVGAVVGVGQQGNREENKENINRLAVVPQPSSSNNNAPQQQAIEDSAAARAKAAAAVKELENKKLREEMNRDMQQMEAKLVQLKRKKEDEELARRAKAAEERRQRELLVEEGRRKEEERRRREAEAAQRRADAAAAAAIYNKGAPSVAPAPPAVAAKSESPPPHQAPRALPTEPVAPPALVHEERAAHALPAAQYPQPHPTAARYVEKPQNLAAMLAGDHPPHPHPGLNPRPPESRFPMRHPVAHDPSQGPQNAQLGPPKPYQALNRFDHLQRVDQERPVRYIDSHQAHPEAQPGYPRLAEGQPGFSKLVRPQGKPTLQFGDDGGVRHSFPHAQKAPLVPNRLQVVPQAELWAGPDELLRDDALNADLIMRQKHLDRQRARNMVAQDTDKELHEFEMDVHRINRAVGQAASQRPMLLPGEVGAKISERDRQMRTRQQQHAQRSQQRHDMQPSVRIFGDVAYEGGLYSPMKKQGLYYEEEVEEEDMHAAREESPQEVPDEELLYYDREVERFEHEVAQRTLKIQMLKTACMSSPVVSDDEEGDEY